MATAPDFTNFRNTMHDNLLGPTSFADAAALRTKNSAFMIGGEIVTVLTPASGNGYTFVWVPADTTADDGVTSIKPTNVASTSPGRWRRIATPQLYAEATYNPASLADGAGATTTVAVPGAALGDIVLVSFSLTLQAVHLFGYIQAADNVEVRFQNESGGVVDLAEGTIRVLVLKR